MGDEPLPIHSVPVQLGYREGTLTGPLGVLWDYLNGPELLQDVDLLVFDL